MNLRGYPRRFWVRLIAALLCLTVPLSELKTFAQASPSDSVPVSQNTIPPIELPHDLGVILPRSSENISPRHGSQNLVVHIQDAHGQPDAQQNMEAILQHLTRRYGFKALFVEGAFNGVVANDLLSFFKNRKRNEEIARDLLQQNIIGGAELFSLRSGAACQIKGLEDPDLYRKNISAFRKVYAQRRLARQILQALDRRIRKISAGVFNRDLRQFFVRWMVLDDGSTRLSRIETLRRYAQQQIGLDLRDSGNQWKYPQLVRLFKLKDLQENIQNAVSSKKLRFEKEKLIRWLERSDKNILGKDTIRALKTLLDENRTDTASKNTRFWVERFYEQSHPMGFKFEEYPNIALILGAQILQEELAGLDLYDEMHGLTVEILNTLIKSENERKLVAVFSDYRLLKKLFKLELSRPELDEMAEKKYAAAPGALFKQLMVLDRRVTLPDARHLAESDRLFRNALSYYRQALERDRIMFENFSNAFRQNKLDKAILITGGFHEKGLDDRLKKEGFSVFQIQPRINRPEPQEKYLDSMLLRSHASSTLKPVSPGLIPLPAIRQSIGLEDYVFYRSRLIRTIQAATQGREIPEPGPAFQAQALNRAEIIAAGFGSSQESDREGETDTAQSAAGSHFEKAPVKTGFTTAQKAVRTISKVAARIILLNILLVFTTALPIRFVALLEGVISVQFQMRLIVSTAGAFLAWLAIKGIEILHLQSRPLKHRWLYVTLPPLLLFVFFEVSAWPAVWLALFTISTIASFSADGGLESNFKRYAVFNRLWPNRVYKTMEKIPFVLLHLFALRFFYVPLFFGILPWSVKMSDVDQVTVYGVEKTEKKNADLTDTLRTFPDSMFDRGNSEALKRIFFFPWPPESAMWLAGSRFVLLLDNQLIIGTPQTRQGGIDREMLKHEFGHFVFSRPSLAAFLEEWARLYQIYRRDTHGYNLGNRSLANENEGISEWFRQYDRLLTDFEGLDSTAKQMWMAVAQPYISGKLPAAKLKIVYPGQKTAGYFPVDLDERGQLTENELGEIVKRARQEITARIALKKDLLTPASHTNLLKSLESPDHPEAAEEFALLSLLIDPDELMEQSEALTYTMTGLLERQETKRGVKYSAAEFLGKLGNEKALDALGKALFTLAPPPDGTSAARIFPINLRILRVFEKMPPGKTALTLTTALERLLHGGRSLDQSEAIVRVMITRNARTERDRQILDEILRLHGNDEKFNAGDLARQYLKEVEATLDHGPGSNESGFGASSSEAAPSIGEHLFKRPARWTSLNLLTQEKQDIVYKIISVLPMYSNTFLDLDSAEREIYIWTFKRYLKWYALPFVAAFAMLIIIHYTGNILGIWKTPIIGNTLKNYFTYMTDPDLPLNVRMRYPFTETLKTLFHVWSGPRGRITLILFGAGFLGYWKWLHRKWFPPFRFRRIHIWPYGSNEKFLRRTVAEFERSFHLRHGTLPRSEERLRAALNRRFEEASRLPRPGSIAVDKDEDGPDSAPDFSPKGFGKTAEASPLDVVGHPIEWKHHPTFSDRAVAEITGGIFHIEQAAFIGGDLAPLRSEQPAYFGFFRSAKLAREEPLRVVVGFEDMPNLDDPRVQVITEFLAQNKNAQVVISTGPSDRGALLKLNQEINRKIMTGRKKTRGKFSGVGLTVIGPEVGRLNAFVEGKAAKTLVYDARANLLTILRNRVKDKDRVFWVEHDVPAAALLELEALALLNAIDQFLLQGKPPAGVQKAFQLLERSENVDIRLRTHQLTSRAA